MDHDIDNILRRKYDEILLPKCIHADKLYTDTTIQMRLYVRNET